MMQSWALAEPWPSWSFRGHKVYKLTLTNNETRFEQKGIEVNYESSVSQSAEACRILGVTETDFEPVECSHLFYSTEVIQRVEKIVYDPSIDTAFIHYQSDMNQDHVEASRITMTALRHCKNILMYQSNGYILKDAYYPRFFVDISETLEKKQEALRCCGREHDRYGRLFDIVCKRNEIWGYYNETAVAEGFYVVKMLF